MKTNAVIFIVAFLLAFGGGYLYFSKGGDAKEDKVSQTEPAESGKEDDKDEERASVPAEAQILETKNCLSCHAVSSLGVEGGTTGPDLSKAYEGVKDKHGIDLDEFLQHPTSAVMSGVIAGNPLTDEERAAVIDVLKTASEK